MNGNAADGKPSHFIRDMIAADVAAGRNGGRVVTRFPPEPNGYLHIGHAKAVCIDFGMAAEFGGTCHLRMDDTNPAKESMEYVEAICRDILWLGFDWGDRFHYAADYFDRMFECARKLIGMGKAYVCELSQEAWKDYRGVPDRPGRDSPFRNRPPEESLGLFDRMRAGEFPDGSLCLRAKIDMASPNLHLRDPVLYRILRAHHYRTGDSWVVYPTYDFAHPLEDAFEGITHSLCTLEFEVHRPLYDWVVDTLGFDSPRPRQTEFARLSLTHTVMSKRMLLELVRRGDVTGWDDPRMPTLCGMRRRGYPPEAIRVFCDRIGVTKYESLTDAALLEHCVREALNRTAARRMAVLDPLKVVLENVGEGESREASLPNNPEDPAAGSRTLVFGRTILIDRGDFMEDPPKSFFRLAPGRAVRLRGAGFLVCTGTVKDASGAVVEVRGTWIPMSEPVKVRSTIQWVPGDAPAAETRLYDRLFVAEDMGAIPEDRDVREYLNPDSLKTVTARVEPALLDTAPGAVVQFERVGYFCADGQDSQPGAPVFNRAVGLKDPWAKARAKNGADGRPRPQP